MPVDRAGTLDGIDKRLEPWCELAEIARRGEADVALLQETGSPPDDLSHLLRYEDDVFWDRSFYDRWLLVVQLSDRVEVEWFRQVPPFAQCGPSEADRGRVAVHQHSVPRRRTWPISLP